MRREKLVTGKKTYYFAGKTYIFSKKKFNQICEDFREQMSESREKKISMEEFYEIFAREVHLSSSAVQRWRYDNGTRKNSVPSSEEVILNVAKYLEVDYTDLLDLIHEGNQVLMCDKEGEKEMIKEDDNLEKSLINSTYVTALDCLKWEKKKYWDPEMEYEYTMAQYEEIDACIRQLEVNYFLVSPKLLQKLYYILCEIRMALGETEFEVPERWKRLNPIFLIAKRFYLNENSKYYEENREDYEKLLEDVYGGIEVDFEPDLETYLPIKDCAPEALCFIYYAFRYEFVKTFLAVLNEEFPDYLQRDISEEV